MRQWRCRVARVRQQPLILAASLQPRTAFSEPLFVAGTSKRAANSQTWAAVLPAPGIPSRTISPRRRAGGPEGFQYLITATGVPNCVLCSDLRRLNCVSVVVLQARPLWVPKTYATRRYS